MKSKDGIAFALMNTGIYEADARISNVPEAIEWLLYSYPSLTTPTSTLFRQENRVKWRKQIGCEVRWNQRKAVSEKQREIELHIQWGSTEIIRKQFNNLKTLYDYEECKDANRTPPTAFHYSPNTCS